MSAYRELADRHRRMSAIEGALAVLEWDRAVMMPDGGAGTRVEQTSALQLVVHEAQTAPDMDELISEAENDGSLDCWERANVREMRHDWLHSNAVPAELVERRAKAHSACEMTWRSAREENDFAKLEPKLTEVLNVARETAAVKSEAFGCGRYDALLDEYDPGRRSADVDRLFSRLQEFLPGLLEKALERQRAAPPAILPQGPFAVAAQESLGRRVMELFGFDFAHGRLDVSHHPFSAGTPDDSRVTTRYSEDDFTKSLMAIIHETGHAQYERGLPEAWRGQPVGRSRGMTLHESQSLLFEMLAARSPEFIGHVAPLLREAFGGSGEAWETENLVRLYHRVEPGPIRVDADEITYPLHVILRHRLESDMIEGRLEARDLPEAWNEGMRELLGVTPRDDAEGCMQDIHWHLGAFGYFPTYTLGALGASQIFAAAVAKDETIVPGISRGDFSGLIGWLRTNVHEKASSLTPDELIVRATGAPLDTAAFKAHLEARYLRS